MPPLWFCVEEWQIESGEVPLYAVGETVGLLPQFHWIGHPEEKTADATPYVRHHTLDRLDVCLPQRITATGEVYVELGGEVWDTLSGVREVREGVVLEGSMTLSVSETDRRWSNELFAGWTIHEIREVTAPYPDDARLDELAVPVQQMTGTPGRFYFLRCTPEPSYAVGLTEDEAHEIVARVRRTAGFTAKIHPVRTYFSVAVKAPLTRWRKKNVVLYEEAHWQSLLEDLPRFQRMHAAETRSRRARRWRRVGVRRSGRYAG